MYIIEKVLPLTFNIIQRKRLRVMFFARMKSPLKYKIWQPSFWTKSCRDETGYSHSLLSISKNVKILNKLSNQTFPVLPIHIYDKFKLNVIYSIHSGKGVHSFLRKQRFFRDYFDFTYPRLKAKRQSCEQTCWLIFNKL